MSRSRPGVHLVSLHPAILSLATRELSSIVGTAKTHHLMWERYAAQTRSRMYEDAFSATSMDLPWVQTEGRKKCQSSHVEFQSILLTAAQDSRPYDLCRRVRSIKNRLQYCHHG